MIIEIPCSNQAERKYVINTIFNEFLGLEYLIKETDRQNYSIKLCNNNIITFEDHFFLLDKELEYLRIDKIPSKIKFFSVTIFNRHNIPIIYGTDHINIEENSISCGLDIVASSFYMLSRWEEFVNKKRDRNNRFSGIESIAYKYGFLHRPIVNEYVEMLWNMLKYLGYEGDRKKREFKIVPTHDVDAPLLYPNLKAIARSVKNSNRTKKILGLIVKSFQIYTSNILQRFNDPYNTFNEIMDISEKANTKSHFFFMSAKKSDYDPGYNLKSNFINKITSSIKKRGHKIGFHPGYYSFNNSEIWAQEYNHLVNELNYDIKSGRQHYLRFETPLTWNIWDKHDMEWDSSLGYADVEGFRCGTCYEFPVFDFINRKVLKLKEKPLILMEGTLVQYQKYTPEEALNKVISLKKTVQKYNGEFVFLWHNSAFNNPVFDDYRHIYKNLILSSH